MGNDFETDVDIWLPDALPWPFADYTLIHKIVADIFSEPAELLETVVQRIHTLIGEMFPFAEKVKVCVRKLHPPMSGHVVYSQVCYEK
jgi:7,8-dihydroneopterin aldolase/epimerase/oxygenase